MIGPKDYKDAWVKFAAVCVPNDNYSHESNAKISAAYADKLLSEYVRRFGTFSEREGTDVAK